MKRSLKKSRRLKKTARSIRDRAVRKRNARSRNDIRPPLEENQTGTLRRLVGHSLDEVGSVGGRKARVLRDIVARRELAAIAREEIRNIAAKLKTVHDVVKLRRVHQAESVAGLMQASQVDDRVAQQPTLYALRRDPHIHLCAPPSIHHNRHRF